MFMRSNLSAVILGPAGAQRGPRPEDPYRYGSVRIADPCGAATEWIVGSSPTMTVDPSLCYRHSTVDDQRMRPQLPRAFSPLCAQKARLDLVPTTLSVNPLHLEIA